MDCFYEQFQTKDYSKIEKRMQILSRIALVMAILFLATLNVFGAIVFILMYLIVFIMSRKLIVEFEYELTGDELSIYKIMNKSKRKEIGSINIKQISSVKKLDKISSNTKLVKAYLEESENKPMVYLTKKSEGLVGFQLAIDENLMHLIKKVNPLIFY